MKHLCLALCILISQLQLFPQARKSLSLEEAYGAFEANYPLLGSDSLVDRIYKKELEKLKLDRRPDLFLQAEARIQTETVSLPEDSGLPLDIDLPLYSFKPFLELNYALYDGGLNKAQGEEKHAAWEVEKKSLEVERYGLRKRINGLFVGIALYKAQEDLLAISQADLLERRKILEAGLQSGLVLESEVSKLKVRELELEAQAKSLQFSIAGNLNTLSVLIGMELEPSIEIILPLYQSLSSFPQLNRPEQELFLSQQRSLLSKEGFLEAQHRPRIQLFAQGGGGIPNPLNFFDNNFSPYGIAGISFQWKLSDKKQLRQDREILFLRARQIQKQKETFDFNMESANAKYQSSIENLEAQIQQDQEIAQLQAEILSQLATQLENGIITSADYLIQSNAELRARQNLELHKIRLIQTQLDFLTERGSNR
ncbi:MAG: TolC family protein [Bacteroidota bacterium]